MYKLEFSRSKAARFIKKSDPSLKKQIEEELSKIAQHPFLNENLKGKFKDLKCQHFSFRGTQYRIAYSIYDEKSTVGIFHIGTRERFYDELSEAF